MDAEAMRIVVTSAWVVLVSRCRAFLDGLGFVDQLGLGDE